MKKLQLFRDDERRLICKPYSRENLHLMAQEMKITRGWYVKGYYLIPKKRLTEVERQSVLIESSELTKIIELELTPCAPPNKKYYKENSFINDLFFIREVESKKYPDGSVIRKGLFKCTCNKEFVTDLQGVVNKETISCGCRKSQRFKELITKHGKSGTPEYICWNNIKDRCRNKNNFQYKDYGERGIVVCDRWLYSFSNFLEDMGEKPSNAHSIDRIDVNGNYCPENCRWATNEQQCSNKRNSVLLLFDGEIKTLTKWASIFDMSPKTLKWRLFKGMSVEEALTTPIDERFKYKNKQK